MKAIIFSILFATLTASAAELKSPSRSPLKITLQHCEAVNDDFLSCRDFNLNHSPRFIVEMSSVNPSYIVLNSNFWVLGTRKFSESGLSGSSLERFYRFVGSVNYSCPLHLTLNENTLVIEKAELSCNETN